MSINRNSHSTVHVEFGNPRKLDKDEINSRCSSTPFQQQSSKSSLVPNDRNYAPSIRVNIETISHFIFLVNIQVLSIYKGN